MNSWNMLLSWWFCRLQTATAVREAGGEALVVVGDVTADDFATKIVEATVKEYGGIDILINNAGK